MSEIRVFSTIGMRTVLEKIAKAFVADLASSAHAALIRRKGVEPV